MTISQLVSIDPAPKRRRACRQDQGLRGQDRGPGGQAPSRDGKTTGQWVATSKPQVSAIMSS